MGATEGCRETPVGLDEIQSMLETWRGRIGHSGSFIMPYAEDAEYIGSSAYFYVKQFNQARFFEPEPGSVTRFRQLLDLARNTGYELSTPSDVIASAATPIVNDRIDCIENGAAWHGGTSKAWANTSYSRILDPVCRSLYDGVVALRQMLGKAMANGGIAEKRAVYSAPLMKTQIAAIETLLMKQDYFGEK